MQRKTSFNFKFLCRRLYIVLFENMSCQSELELVLLSTTVVPQPLRRLITQIGFGDKILKLKRYRVFDQIFFENICRQAFFEKGCATTVDSVDHAFTRGFSVKPFLKRLASKQFLRKACGTRAETRFYSKSFLFRM
ncbi:hypothetical protein A9239_07025 [Methanosarcina sp. A14]|uniref:Uncharacterized protein n=2 Tax=Methanosarcina TaxID=2207 RepID=A0A0G3CC17_METBA|nr:hypothetical protein MCM1_1137 [Methanosarcina barkeri CM1]OED10846.1 hypothetical protein A9239_07025 [Methanosarcina sp. A14]